MFSNYSVNHLAYKRAILSVVRIKKELSYINSCNILATADFRYELYFLA
jgi:hypothetical protein